MKFQQSKRLTFGYPQIGPKGRVGFGKGFVNPLYFLEASAAQDVGEGGVAMQNTQSPSGFGRGWSSDEVR